jgi:hypothetical protein
MSKLQPCFSQLHTVALAGIAGLEQVLQWCPAILVREGRSACCAGQDWHGCLLLAAVVVEGAVVTFVFVPRLFEGGGLARLPAFEVCSGASVVVSRLCGLE